MGPAADDLLALAVRLAEAAGDLLVGQRPDRLQIGTKSTPTDVVTEMDRAAERLILDGIRRARPDDAVLAEESGGGSGVSGVRWLVDPIDGTVNYLYGIPDFAVSIAAEVDGEVAVGVVHDPSKRLTYSAVRGAGSRCNGAPLSCSAVTELAQTLVATGFGYAASDRARQAQVLTRVLPRVRDIRRIGAAALDLCSVAAGRVDAFYERGLSPWDLAAGALVAREAGVRVEGLHGRPPGSELVIAAPPAVFDALHDLLAAAGAGAD